MKDLVNRLMAFTGDGVYRYTFEEGRILVANAGLARILDLDCAPGDLAGKCLKDVLIYTEKAGVVRSTMEKTGELHGFEYHFKTLKGEDRWVIHDSFIVTDPTTKERVVEAIVKDITARKRAEQELAKAHADLARRVRERTAELTKANILLHQQMHERRVADQRHSLMLQAALDGFWVADAQGRFLEVNEAYCRMSGYSRGELLKMKIRDVEAAERFEETEAHMQRIIQNGADRFETRHRRKDGTVFEVEASATHMTEDGGRFVVFLRDITERKRAAEHLARTMANLEQSNRELEQFAYVASHDLQEPLRKIDAFAERLRTKCEAQLSAEGLDYLMRVQSASTRMGRLITDLLIYSRITTRAKPCEPVDLNRVASEVLSDLEVRIQQTGARVTVGPLPTVEADATQMRQLLQNLLGNALKFRRPDAAPQVEMSARLREEEDPPRRCEITVKDNGIGFDEKYAERIFEIFQRLHARDEYEGSGIGLAVCRKIVQRHGGTITAHGAPGTGATFVVVLPLKQAEPGVTS